MSGTLARSNSNSSLSSVGSNMSMQQNTSAATRAHRARRMGKKKPLGNITNDRENLPLVPSTAPTKQIVVADQDRRMQDLSLVATYESQLQVSVITRRACAQECMCLLVEPSCSSFDAGGPVVWMGC